MMVRDGLLALLLAGAMLGPWHTANRLSRLIAATGACPDLWPTSGVLIEDIHGAALRGEHLGAGITGEPHSAGFTGRASRLNPGDHQ